MPLAYGLIHPVDLSLANLPPSLDGLRIAQISDLHVRRWSKRLSQLINQITSLRLDLVLLTGDYMHLPGHESVTMEIMQRLTSKLRPPLGIYGVCGNHDEVPFCDQLESLPVQWLRNESRRLTDKPIDLLGLHQARGVFPDSVALALDWADRPVPADPTPTRPRPKASKPSESTKETAKQAATKTAKESSQKKPVSRTSVSGSDRLRVMLCHHLGFSYAALDMGCDLVLSGHTHGGQWRLPGGRPLYNGTDLPLRLTSGVFRHRNTLMCVSRGIGESGPAVRFWCPPHIPVYTLRRRSGPGQGGQDIEVLEEW